MKGAFIPFRVLTKFEGVLLDNYKVSKFFIENGSPGLLDFLSKKKAFAIHKLALDTTPAYKKFTKSKKYQNIEGVPQTDKKKYVKKYVYEDRCQGGKFPKIGNIQESSGSSGTPTNWFRHMSEDELLFKAAKFEFFYVYNADKIDYITLSGWSSGPWATGLKFCELLERYTLVKNSTADIDNIVRTLKQLGKKYNYLIAGYPPFLKNLFDSKQINWKKYKIDVLTGGESTSVAWKRYIKKQLGNDKVKIISSYGASDIDIGVGFETPFSEFIREFCLDHPELNQKLFGTSQNPIVFQYNPLMHYIENTEKGDFNITILDENVTSPKVKYNLHDQGGKISYKEMIKVLKKYDKRKLKAFTNKNKTLKLPFLYVCGRIDGTISIGGNNIYPEQIGTAIQESKFASAVNRFMIGSSHDQNFNVKFDVHVELKKGTKENAAVKATLEKVIFKTLMDKNLEFKEYYQNHKSNQKYLKPQVSLYKFDKEEIFKKQDGKLKNSYILKN
jgi:phenylacetate-CoA ligase